MSQILTRYPPVRDTGDDEITVHRNIELLRKELDSQKPRKEIVLTLSAQTFISRREAILNESAEVTASSLLAEYRELKKPYVVSKQARMHAWSSTSTIVHFH